MNSVLLFFNYLFILTFDIQLNLAGFFYRFPGPTRWGGGSVKADLGEVQRNETRSFLLEICRAIASRHTSAYAKGYAKGLKTTATTSSHTHMIPHSPIRTPYYSS